MNVNIKKRPVKAFVYSTMTVIFESFSGTVLTQKSFRSLKPLGFNAR